MSVKIKKFYKFYKDLLKEIKRKLAFGRKILFKH